MVLKKEVEEVSVITEEKQYGKHHIISFAGIEKCDILMYLGKILECEMTTSQYKNVLLIDNSDSKDMYRSAEIFLGKPRKKKKNVPEPVMSDDGSITINRITFMQDKTYDEAFFEEYGYVLFYHGLDVDAEIVQNSDINILCLDYNPVHLQQIQDNLFTGYENTAWHVIFRDKPGKKMKESALLEQQNIKKTKGVEVIPLAPEDEFSYLSLLYNGNIRVHNGLSQGMFDAVVSIALHVLGKESIDKEMKQILKMAGRR